MPPLVYPTSIIVLVALIFFSSFNFMFPFHNQFYNIFKIWQVEVVIMHDLVGGTFENRNEEKS